MRYHFFLHYGWFLQNFEKDFIPTLLHTTVEVILQPSCKYSEARESTQNDGYEMQQCCTTSKIKKGSLDVPLYILNA